MGSQTFTFLIKLSIKCICRFARASACNMDTTPTQPHRNSYTRRTKNNTTNVVIQQNSRKLQMMDILMSETCWAHKKWNKVASDIKLVLYSSTITKLHGPINIILYNTDYWFCRHLIPDDGGQPKHVTFLMNTFLNVPFSCYVTFYTKAFYYALFYPFFL